MPSVYDSIYMDNNKADETEVNPNVANETFKQKLPQQTFNSFSNMPWSTATGKTNDSPTGQSVIIMNRTLITYI